MTDLDLPDLGPPVSDLSVAQMFAGYYGDDIRWHAGFGWLIRDRDAPVWRDTREPPRVTMTRVTDGRIAWIQEAASQATGAAMASSGNVVAFRSRTNPVSLPVWQGEATDMVTSLEAYRSNKACKDALEMARSTCETTDTPDSRTHGLNTPAGYYDLRRRCIIPHPEICLRLTKGSPGSPGDGAWARTVLSVFQGDVETANYFQRLIGYAAIGTCDLELAHFIQGPPGCGKGTLIEPIIAALGDYAEKSSPALICRGGGHGSVLAAIEGKRLVVVNELDDGAHLNENRYKELVDCGTVQMRRLYHEAHMARITWNVIVTCNQLPAISGNDGSVERRTRVIALQPLATAKDASLKRRLIAGHLDEILAWIVDGAEQYEAHGLTPSPAIREATDAYFRSEDSVGQWLDAFVLVRPDTTVSQADLHAAYKNQAGKFPKEIRAFNQALRAHALRKGWPVQEKNRCWIGAGLIRSVGA